MLSHESLPLASSHILPRLFFFLLYIHYPFIILRPSLTNSIVNSIGPIIFSTTILGLHSFSSYRSKPVLTFTPDHFKATTLRCSPYSYDINLGLNNATQTIIFTIIEIQPVTPYWHPNLGSGYWGGRLLLELGSCLEFLILFGAAVRSLLLSTCHIFCCV